MKLPYTLRPRLHHLTHHAALTPRAVATPQPLRRHPVLLPVSPARTHAAFLSATPDRKSSIKNQIYSPVRNPDSFQTYLSLSSTSRTPLLTLWTASYCPTCRTVSPLLRDLVSSGFGEAEGGVSLAEVEFDSPDVMGSDLAMTYMITAMPTLLSFDAGEAMTRTKVVDARRLADREFLTQWIREEARRHGGRGGGEGGGSSLFGGLFGGMKS